MTYDFANALKGRPAQADLFRVLGDPRGPREVAGQRRGLFVPEPAWARAHLVQIDTARNLPNWPRYAGQVVRSVTLHRLAADHLIATWAEVNRRGLADKLHSYDGAFVPRHMLWNPVKDLSVHAWGLALDFDASTNMYGIPASRMQINRDFVRCMEECGWTWGGNWTETDGMHFQFTDPLPGTRVPSWQDALARVSRPAAPAPAPTAPTSTSIYVQLREPSGEVRPDWVSVAVDASGHLLVGADGKPRAYHVDAALAAAKGLK